MMDFTEQEATVRPAAVTWRFTAVHRVRPVSNVCTSAYTPDLKALFVWCIFFFRAGNQLTRVLTSTDEFITARKMIWRGRGGGAIPLHKVPLDYLLIFKKWRTNCSSGDN